MMNQKRISVPRLLTPIALAVILTACSSAPTEPVYVDITQDPTQSAQAYTMKADSSEGSIQNDWLIMALKSAVKANNTQQAELLIKRLAKQPLSQIQQAEWQLARAELLANNHQAAQAIAKLNFQADWSLADEQWKDYHQLRAELLESLHQYYPAAKDRSALISFIEDIDKPEAVNKIWRNLAFFSIEELTALRNTENNRAMVGWLDLSIIMKTLSSRLPEQQEALSLWLEDHPEHNAAKYTPQDILDILSLEIIKPQHAAILLPLSGKFSAQAQLVRDGYIFALMNDETRDKEATLTVIDTNAKSAEEVKQTLFANDIDFIIGPLIKSNIEKLQESHQNTELSKQIPALALNIPTNIAEGNNICYFALSPEQEVAQAATHLSENGFQYPLILAPKGAYGERVVKAFQDEWNNSDNPYSMNEVAISYFGNKRQLQKDINSIYGLQESQSRIAQLTNLTGLDLETTPRSRRDIDSVYIIAKSSELTLIKPFIEVAVNPDAKPPKLFSNSRSNSGKKQYEDLSGVEFSDIPLLINGDATLVSNMDELWPESSLKKKRLQALGMDAYKLVTELPQMKVSPDYRVDGQTGKLSIDERCVVQREVDWSEHGSNQ